MIASASLPVHQTVIHGIARITNAPLLHIKHPTFVKTESFGS